LDALRVGGAEAADFGDEAKEFLDGHLRVGGRALGQVAEFALHGDGVGGDIDAVHGGGAGVGAQEAGDQLHRRGLAGAIGAEEAQDVAAFDGESDTVHSANGAESFNQAFNFDHRCRKPEKRKRQETVS
jgi:hypothetical protein